MAGNCGARDDSADRAVVLVMAKGRGHWPRRFADNNCGANAIVGERATSERVRDESGWIDGVHCRPKNVVKIGAKPLKRTAQ